MRPRSEPKDAVGWTVIATALALPFVRIEPAPVDAAMIGAAMLAAFAGLRVPAIVLGGVLAYAIGSALAIGLGLSVPRVEPSFAARYVAIETLLLVAIAGFAAILTNRPGLHRSFLKAYVIGAVLSTAAIWAIWLVDPVNAPIFRDESRVRLQGFFRDPNVLGPYLLFPLAALLHARRALGLARTWWVAAIPLAALAMMTYSRAAWIGLAIVAISALPRLGRLRRPAASLAAAAVAVSVTILALNVVSLDPSRSEAPATSYLSKRTGLQDYDSHRFSDIAAAVEIGVTHPLGVGPAGFGRMTGTNNAHNLFLGKLTDAGLIPALLTVLLPVAGMATAWRHRMTSGGIGMALAVTLAAHLVISLVIYSHHWRHMLLLSVAGLATPALSRDMTVSADGRRSRPRGIGTGTPVRPTNAPRDGPVLRSKRPRFLDSLDPFPGVL